LAYGLWTYGYELSVRISREVLFFGSSEVLSSGEEAPLKIKDD
jgi:hypothetical protein